MPAPPGSTAQRVRAEVAASLRRTLREESRNNELRIAYWRIVLLGPYTALAWIIDLVIDPSPPPQFWIDDTIVTLLLVASVIFARVLSRGWYRGEIRFLVPVADALLLFFEYQVLFQIYPAAQLATWQVRTLIGLFAAVIILTGCARLDPKVAYLTTALGIGDYILLTGDLGWIQTDLFAVSILAAIGYLGVWLTHVVTRAAENQVARATLRRFLPDSVIEQAHRDPLELLVEPKTIDVTIVVTDIRGFTPFSESRPPAEVFNVLNEIHGTMADVVRRHGGTIDKFTGDGMLAIFGLPATANHVNDALEASIEIQSAARELSDRFKVTNDFDVQIGIGVHSGNVLVGCIGSDARLEFTVIGDAVNTAFRIQDLTKELKANVLASDETVRAARNTACSFRPLGPIRIRGKMNTLHLFAVEDRRLTT